MFLLYLGCTLAKPLIPSAATATPKSNKVGRERAITSLPNSRNSTNKPTRKAKKMANTVPIYL